MSAQLMSRRGMFRAVAGAAGALVLPEEPEGMVRTGRIYSFAKELRVPGVELGNAVYFELPNGSVMPRDQDTVDLSRLPPGMLQAVVLPLLLLGYQGALKGVGP